MDNQTRLEEIKGKVLLHMYNSVIRGSVNSIGAAVRTTLRGANTRLVDLQALYSALGPSNERIFFNGVVAIAEFVAYGVLDFLETYNRFDSEDNSKESPRLELAYVDSEGPPEVRYKISEFGSEQLGMLFKQIARDLQVRQLVDATISDQLPVTD